MCPRVGADQRKPDWQKQSGFLLYRLGDDAAAEADLLVLAGVEDGGLAGGGVTDGGGEF